MGRWEPNADERLILAALELFVERGYDNTTVAEITERAGLTKRTFFRHFTDKREVLFFGQDLLIQVFGDTIAGAPESASPLDAIGAALEAAEVAFSPERHEFARQRQAVIAANTDLRERELLKRAVLTAAMTYALGKRGVPEPTASIVAELGGLAFRMTFARWVEPDNQRKFAELARETLQELRTAAGGLD